MTGKEIQQKTKQVCEFLDALIAKRKIKTYRVQNAFGTIDVDVSWPVGYSTMMLIDSDGTVEVYENISRKDVEGIKNKGLEDLKKYGEQQGAQAIYFRGKRVADGLRHLALGNWKQGRRQVIEFYV